MVRVKEKLVYAVGAPLLRGLIHTPLLHCFLLVLAKGCFLARDGADRLYRTRVCRRYKSNESCSITVDVRCRVWKLTYEVDEQVCVSEGEYVGLVVEMDSTEWGLSVGSTR